jgi:galactose-1-phosphate uridylyltransferase
MPRKPIHSWESIEESHLVAMNLLIKEFLEKERKKTNLNDSAGLRIGFNSSIRHLVRGKAMLSSAGASIAHVHKQVWGMAPGSVNLGDHLSNICEAYSRHGIDYLWSYYRALKEAGLVLWEDENVVLFIPYGQISMHELQVMVKRRNTNHYLELSDEEIRSLSEAEFKVTRLFRELGINSFNEVMISRPFDSKTEGFRIIFTYITREVDFAVSELNLLYVVDKHPYDTLDEVKSYLPHVAK